MENSIEEGMVVEIQNLPADVQEVVNNYRLLNEDEKDYVKKYVQECYETLEKTQKTVEERVITTDEIPDNFIPREDKTTETKVERETIETTIEKA